MHKMTCLGSAFLVVFLLGWATSLGLEFIPRFYAWPFPADINFILGAIVILSTLIVTSWSAVATLSLPVALIFLRSEHWRYLLVVGVLASWLAMHLLNFVSDFTVWFVDLFKVCWLTLLFLAVAAPFFRRWRELAILSLTLFDTLIAFACVYLGPEKGGLLPNRWLQEAGFRIYASHLIRSTPIEEFLSRCELVDYVEEDGARQQVGECGKGLGLRSTLWFETIVIYDPSGQSALPAIQRTLAWRLAVLHLPAGRFFVHDDVASRLPGKFYWIVAPGA